MATASKFPAIVSLEYQRNGSMLPAMRQDIDSAFTAAGRQAETLSKRFGDNISSMTEKAIKSQLDGAIGRFKTAAGALDLDLSGMRAAVAVQQKRVAGANQLAAAYRDVASATGVMTAEASRAVAVADASVNKETEALRIAQARLVVTERLQTELVRAQQALAKTSRAGPNTSFGVDSLLGVSGALDRAAASGVTLENVLGRVSNKGREVTAALQAMGQEQDTLAKYIERVNRATMGRANSESGADRILGGKAAIDRAAVSMASLESVMGRLTREGQKSREALIGVGVASEQMGKKGATANHMVVNSTRSLNAAMLQSGQQLQDIAISLYSGQRAGVVFAQQLPQLAFALTGLEGSANKTHNRIGRFATYLAGPWGLAVGLGVGALATFIANLISSGDEAEKSERAQRSLADVLKDSASSWSEVAKAAKDYAEQQKEARKVSIEAVAEEANAIAVRLQSAVATRQQLQAELELRLERERSIARGSRSDPGATGAIAGAAALTTLTANQIAANEKALQALEKAAGESVIKVANAVSELNIDPTEKIREGFSVLRNEARETIKDVTTLTARLTELGKQEKAAIDAAKSAERGRTGSGGTNNNTRDARVGDMTALIRQLFPGARITSTTGGKHTKGSDHYAGRAIDFVPAGGMGQYSTADVQRILEEAGVTIRRGKSGTQQIFGPGKSASKPGDHDDHFHVAWSGSASPEKADAAAERMAREAERAAEATARLTEFGRDAQAQIAAIGSSFARTPPAIQESQRELERLNDLAADIMLRKPKGWEAMLAAIIALRPEAEALANGPFRDMLESAEEQARIEQLLIAGKTEEAEIQRRIHDLVKAQGPLTAGQEETLRGVVAQERVRARLLELQAESRERELRLLEDTRNNITQTTYELLNGKGAGAVGNFFKRQFDNVMADMAESITESLFGDMFRDQKDKILGFDKVKESSLEAARTSNVASEALAAMAKAARNATDALAGVAANENSSGQGMVDPVTGDIVVSGRHESTRVLKDISKNTAKYKTPDETFTKLTATLKQGMEGAAIGQMTSGIVKSLGLKQSKTGSQVGGAIGNFIPGLPPGVGSAIGGLLGGTIGGFFKNSRSAGATITGANSISVGGKDGKNYGAANDLASSVVSGLQSIAEQLGGTIGSFNTTIGMRGGDYRVNTSGSSLKVKKGATDFNDDAEGAIKFAIADAIKDGAIIGLRAATQRLLQSGKDVEAQLAKAVKFQSVFDELESIKDPVGAAVKSLNREFEGLISVFREAGASAEEYAKLEELYSLKRVSAIDSANNAAIGSFRSFIDGLTIGNDALSLRDRRAEAMGRYSALSERVKAGDTTAYDEYQEVSGSLLDIQRQISGSQNEYFALLAEVTALSRSVVDATGKVASLPGGFSDLMGGGQGGGTGSAGGAPNWWAYLQANPDVMRDYTSKVDKRRFSTAESYGQWHYDNYGRGEGRALPTSQASLGGAVTAQTQELMTGFDANQSALRAINDNLGTLIRQTSGNANYLSALGAGGHW